MECYKETPDLTAACIAQHYPHIFWSLIYHYIPLKFGKDGADAADDMRVEDMMKDLCKDLDWEHMTRGGRVSGNRYGVIRDSNEMILPSSLNNSQYCDLVNTVDHAVNSLKTDHFENAFAKMKPLRRIGWRRKTLDVHLFHCFMENCCIFLFVKVATQTIGTLLTLVKNSIKPGTM